MTSELVTSMGSVEIGRLRRDRSGRLSFAYAVDWQQAQDAHPLSLSMPLLQREHAHRVVSAYIAGLLPDNELILERWARKFQVSPNNPYALIAKVGDDCAGAVRFAETSDSGAPVREGMGQVHWLTEVEIAERLRALTRDVSAWRALSDVGQFSLAGAQPKTAFVFDGARWGVPSGRIPTTHIFKPGIEGLDGHAENEHFCLMLARALELPTVSSEVHRFQDQVAIVIERYDRIRSKRQVVRVHQEDVCQALAVPPGRKYENEGGPGARAVVELLREHSSAREDDIATFVNALAFNWLIAGTDAHAKNYSLLIAPQGRVRLAPLYDLASALPYDHFQLQKLKLAMKIGGKYRVRDIGAHQWSKSLRELRVDVDAVLVRIRTMAEALPDLAADELRRCKRAGLVHPVLGRLAHELRKRAASLTVQLAGVTPN